jgi:hypothetical protein
LCHSPRLTADDLLVRLDLPNGLALETTDERGVID